MDKRDSVGFCFAGKRGIFMRKQGINRPVPTLASAESNQLFSKRFSE